MLVWITISSWIDAHRRCCDSLLQFQNVTIIMRKMHPTSGLRVAWCKVRVADVTVTNFNFLQLACLLTFLALALLYKMTRRLQRQNACKQHTDLAAPTRCAQDMSHRGEGKVVLLISQFSHNLSVSLNKTTQRRTRSSRKWSMPAPLSGLSQREHQREFGSPTSCDSFAPHQNSIVSAPSWSILTLLAISFR